MRKIYFLIILFPFLGISQSGISLSGTSMFYLGQTLFPSNTQELLPINFQARNTKVTLSMFRGRKFKFGTLALNVNMSYSINNIKYSDSELLGIYNHETSTKNLIPELELWYIILQTRNIFIYSSVGGYGVLSDLNTSSSDDNNILHEYNQLIPFARIGLQLNYGKFFINPFISFDLKGIEFDKINEIWQAEFRDLIQNYNIRSGLELGIMF